MKQFGSNNGNFKPISQSAIISFENSYALGNSLNTISIKWKIATGEYIDPRRIGRHLKLKGIELRKKSK